MGRFGLDDWDAVASERPWPALLIGNGSSRAVSAKFSYASLFDAAPLSPADKLIFNSLGTRDFEEVLDRVGTAKLICEQVGHDADDIASRYSSIRCALITAVETHHVTWQEVAAGGRLLKIRQALRAHSSVFTTSYDLLVYWTIMSAGAPPGDGFGDLFWNASVTFDPLDTDPFGEKTIAYWLHGGLHLYRAGDGTTKKRTSSGSNLLDTFASDGRIPLFVSEGTAGQKRRAIRRSDYLEHAYNAFASGEDNLVIFGQALAESDSHLVQAVERMPGRKLAYGIYANTPHDANLQRAYIEKTLPALNIKFFDSTTHPLGSSDLLVT